MGLSRRWPRGVFLARTSKPLCFDCGPRCSGSETLMLVLDLVFGAEPLVAVLLPSLYRSHPVFHLEAV